MKADHIPAIMQAGKFVRFNFAKLIEVDETDGLTYTVQFFANMKNDYDQYIQQYSAQLRKEALDKWGGNILSFRTLMEEI